MEKEQQLTNKELDEVNGGYTVFKHTDGKYYEFIGDDSQRNQKYLCPNCGRPVYYGLGWRYYCDYCNDSWFNERKLDANLASGLWVKCKNNN